VPGHELAGHELGPHGTATDTGPAEVDAADRSSGTDAPAGTGLTATEPPRRPGSWRVPRLAALWLSVFAGSLGLFVVRFLVPAPVGQADNHDGPRLMCGLQVAPVTGGHTRWFSYAYFQFHRAPDCAGVSVYPSSQHLLLEAAQWLTPVLGLPGRVNLIALGLLTCAIASFGIATLVTGLRLRLWARLAMAAAVWLVMADAAFFDVYASPFSEGATMAGLLFVAAGVVYLGRGWRTTAFGLLLAGVGGALAIPSKEQYIPLVVPICLTIVLASADRHRGRGMRRFRSWQTGAAVAVVAALALLTVAYVHWDGTSPYAENLHHEQAVDVVFVDIVNGHDNARADLRALGLPASFAKYAGTDAFTNLTVRRDPLYARYESKFTAGNIAAFLLTHPGRMLNIGQLAASYALDFRVTYLGSYPPTAGHPPGALEHRVAVVTWLVHLVPARLGLVWLLSLWAVLAAIATAALLRAGASWRRDAAVLVLCMTGCAIAAFIPPAFFDGISTTRHLVGSNLATALAVAIGSALAVSMLWQARRPLARARPPGPVSRPRLSLPPPASLRPRLPGLPPPTTPEEDHHGRSAAAGQADVDPVRAGSRGDVFRAGGPVRVCGRRAARLLARLFRRAGRPAGRRDGRTGDGILLQLRSVDGGQGPARHLGPDHAGRCARRPLGGRRGGTAAPGIRPRPGAA
jgi:hypothetical protein